MRVTDRQRQTKYYGYYARIRYGRRGYEGIYVVAVLSRDCM